MTQAVEPDDWDAVVSSNERGSYLQTTPWATVKAVNGWIAVRPRASIGTDGSAKIGAQVLVRRPRGIPWAFGYAPRGPVATEWSEPAVGTLTTMTRARFGPKRPHLIRLSHLRIDPEIERDGPLDLDGALRAALRTHGWQPAPPIQPDTTRLIDLRVDEDVLWGDLRKKWRQYVNKARTGGIVVRDVEGDRLPDFYRIYEETAHRAGFLIRTEQAYRDIWEAFRPRGMARLLLAESADGEPQAALFLVSCGPRVVEPYGGMTAAGAESRANYLLKWEAIRSSKAAGAVSYDLWGLAHPGIAHFKEGFGGREVRYIGAWDLVLDRLGRRVFDMGQRGRIWVARRRHGLSGTPAIGAGGAAPTPDGGA